MTPRQRRLASLSRDRGFLIRCAGVIGIAGFVLALVLHVISPNTGDRADPGAPPGMPTPESLSAVRDQLLGKLDTMLSATDEPPDHRERAVLVWIERIAPIWRSLELGMMDGDLRRPPAAAPEPATFTESATARLEKSSLAPSSRDLLVAFLRTTTIERTSKNPRPSHSLINAEAAKDPPPPLANRMAGFLAGMDGDPARAINAYLREAEFHDDRDSRAAAIRFCVSSEDTGLLRRLAADPAFKSAMDPHLRHDVAVALRDYPAIFTSLFAMWTWHFAWPAFLLTLGNAAIWFVIILQMCGIPARKALLWGPPAIALGVASILVTLFFVTLQNDIVGLIENGELINDAIYWTAGVGLREEFSKLLLFAFMVPFLRRTGASDALVLACASWTGLGFAIEENMGYIQRSGEHAVVWSRFLTANFLHLSTTGLAGLAFLRFTRNPKHQWEPFLAAFLGVIGIHAAYDFVLSSPVIGPELAFLHIIFIALLAYWYFGEAWKVRDPARLVISPLAVFVVGSALIVVIALNFTLWSNPFSSGIGNFGQSVLGVAPIAFIFINQFRNA